MTLNPSMSLPASVPRRNMDSDVDHREPAISDQLNVDLLESADPPTDSAPMDGFVYYYLIMN